MVKAPIVPPRKGAQLDMAGDDSYRGLTIQEAEAVNCQSANAGDLFGNGNQANSWGDNGEVTVEYRTSNRKLIGMTLVAGYLGTLDMTSRDGHDAFSIPIQTRITKNGGPYTIDWNEPVKFSAEVNELYDAITATYAPGLPASSAADTSTNCRTTGACITGNFGDVAYLFFPAVGVGLWVASRNAAQPTPSIITRVDLQPAKTLPFSFGSPLLKLDAEGPIATAGALGSAPKPCTVKLGLSFGDFVNTCVKVTGNVAEDDIEFNKLLGGLSHSTERFNLDVQGIDLNFTDRSLLANDIVHDTDLPAPDDVATEFRSNQSTLGRIANDHVANDPAKPKDLHGTGLVYLEYARLVQEELSGHLPPEKRHPLGDPTCLTGIASNTDVDATALSFPEGCTGFEGFVTAVAKTAVAPADPLSRLALGTDVTLLNPAMSLGLKPGHPQAVFCLDANGDPTTGYRFCSAPQGASGDLFATSFARVLQVLGKNKVANLPADAQDQRFFWKQYVKAIIKYLKTVGTTGALGPNETPDGVHAEVVDPFNLFFDSMGSGQFETGEYVDRRFVTSAQDPLDITVTADVKNGIFNSFSFSRDIYRGETAIYTAVVETPGDPPGKEDTALLTNVFGSPVLKNGWRDINGHSAWECATATTTAIKDDCGNQPVPLGDSGTPRLLRYRGAFGSNATAFTLGSTPIQITKTYPNLGQAMISIPIHSTYYDLTTPAVPIQILVPWVPRRPGVGFPVALTGTIDKFIETAQLDFSGTTISATVDYEEAVENPAQRARSAGALEFKAVETADFLGEVFLCQDPSTGDLLGASMYTPVAGILDWFASHPGSYDGCGMIVRYSPFGNYADYITSLTNGVRLGITQGGGFGRVVDVTLFVPGQ